jgi:N-acetyl-alpha-D-glucosaminyl L-malate synthase BshA
VQVIPNFIDPALYDRARHRFPIPEEVVRGRPVLMHISNFRAVKRVRDVVATFARVRASAPALLVMIGDGPERVEAEAEARALGVAEDILFLGKIDAVAPLLAGASLFLLPTDAESFGLSALEALATGVPVIGARAGGLPEVVTHEMTGYLEAVGDVDAMARRCLALLDNPAHWAAMSARAATDARARFAEDPVVARYEALYDRALAAAPAP